MFGYGRSDVKCESQRIIARNMWRGQRMGGIPFFKYIRTYFGDYCCSLLNKYIKLMKTCVSLRIKIRFIRSCIRLDVIPSHINLNRAKSNIKLVQNEYINKLNTISYRYGLSILRLELSDAYKSLQCVRHDMYRVYKSISNVFPLGIGNAFFARQEIVESHLWHSRKERVDKKISWLTNISNKRKKSMIGDINYFCSDVNLVDSDIPRKKISLSNPGPNACHVSLQAKNFKQESSLDSLQHGWFRNLSTYTIPDEIVYLLQLGERFGVPINEFEIPKLITEFIKHIEGNINKCQESIRGAVRNESVSLLNKIANKKLTVTKIDKLILGWINSTKKFIKEHPEILFTRADKGSVTVALDKVEYVRNMELSLSDTSFYEVIVKDPVKKLSSELRSLITRWKNKGYIDHSMYKKLNCTDGILPRAYGLPKIHKPGNPLRIIVSSINSPLYMLACCLHEILSEGVSKSPSHIKNSYHLVNKLNGKPFDSNCTLISLDVVSLFTNVPTDPVVDSVTKRWNEISKLTDIPLDEFTIAIRLILNSTYFSFNNKVYKQIFGSPMGSPLSPIAADMVMCDLEQVAISQLKYVPQFYFRYVDDIAMDAPCNEIENTLEVFNSLHKRLQFTCEIGREGRLNFLDVTIVIEDKRIIFDHFHNLLTLAGI
ncbi:uncharacterized protein [Temnothorax longispinosus]|uniref:uncharacterized protein n=1 Tax=Temnothorax longispinosus TaxID=300112 RepID=UPI003A9A467B